MTKPAHEYRDPLDVLLRAEEQACKGCRYDRRDGPASMTTMRPTQHCALPNNPRAQADQRCQHYEEKP